MIGIGSHTAPLVKGITYHAGGFRAPRTVAPKGELVVLQVAIQFSVRYAGLDNRVAQRLVDHLDLLHPFEYDGDPTFVGG